MLAHGVCDKEKNTKICQSAFTSCHEGAAQGLGGPRFIGTLYPLPAPGGLGHLWGT